MVTVAAKWVRLALACALMALAGCSGTSSPMFAATLPPIDAQAGGDASPTDDAGDPTWMPDADIPDAVIASDGGAWDADKADGGDSAPPADAGPDSAGGWFCNTGPGATLPFCTPQVTVLCVSSSLPGAQPDFDAGAPACPPSQAPDYGPCGPPLSGPKRCYAYVEDVSLGTAAPYPSEGGVWTTGAVEHL